MAARATEKRSSAAEEINGAAEKRRSAMPQMIGFGSSAALTKDALRDRLKAAYAEEEAAGDDVTCLAISCLLTWMNFHNKIPLEETTDLGPRFLTYGPEPPDAMPGNIDMAQVYSFTVKGIKPELGFNWPLHVYGFVAVRDPIDFKRNIIFCRDRDNCQTLTAEDSSLVLTGPSRAVAASDPINFEIELKVKGNRESEDKILSFLVIEHNCIGARYSCQKFYRHTYSNKYCTTEFVFAQLTAAVEATIDVKIVEGSWSQFCPRFVARTKSFPDVDFVLLDHRGGAVVESDEGMMKLTRSVVSVELDGELEFTAEALKPGCRTVVVGDRVQFSPKISGTTEKHVNLGFCKIEVFVSWSLLPVFL